MKFDKTKAYSALNADEIKIGDKGYFAETVERLKTLVEENEKDESDYGPVEEILPEYERERFHGGFSKWSDLFYLVEPSAVKGE